jgi:hypothetical protein
MTWAGPEHCVLQCFNIERLLTPLIFCVIFDHSSYLKYLKLYVIFQISLIIKQIIINYIIFLKIF